VNAQYVRAVFDLDCDWEGLPPTYRIYVNDELFAERSWRWMNCYLEEILQIQAPPGRYLMRFEPIGPQIADFRITNHRIEHGPARWLDQNTLEITA
jgi:hypothetical protein